MTDGPTSGRERSERFGRHREGEEETERAENDVNPFSGPEES
jgi:hypothetical protein